GSRSTEAASKSSCWSRLLGAVWNDAADLFTGTDRATGDNRGCESAIAAGEDLGLHLHGLHHPEHVVFAHGCAVRNAPDNEGARHRRQHAARIFTRRLSVLLG